ncbi:unnamed protein product [Schistocephalus solidus]|uniref:Integrase_H2C2 domain-containing protein n=1 Tax=Schistocephalus solidus TaxID=70667 RepID=A0A183TGL3_SCHSO|nr:unnamed protein product [Schistocephalus solidus]
MDRLARWQEFLQDFDFDCPFRPRHMHGNADALSRLPQNDDLKTDTTTAIINASTTSEPTRHICSINRSSNPDTAIIYRRLTEGLPKPTERDMKGTRLRAQLLRHQLPYLTLQNDIMFLRDPSSYHLRPIVPGCLIETVLNDLHNQLGHCGQRRTVQATCNRFWWPQLRSSTHLFCQSCPTYASFKSPTPPFCAPLQPMTTGLPGERVGLDIIGPLPISVRGHK